MSPESPAVWELRDVLDASVLYCQTFATYLIRAGNPGRATQFDDFANQFDALRMELPAIARHPEANSMEPQLTVPGGHEGREDIKSAASEKALTVPTGKDAPLHGWADVDIRFTSDNRVQVTVGTHSDSLNYAEFGFEDRRSKTPALAWVTLRSLAEAGGTIQRSQNGPAGANLEKRMEKIRSIFRTRFRLEPDPLPFIKGVGYQAQFRISCGPSFDS